MTFSKYKFYGEIRKKLTFFFFFFFAKCLYTNISRALGNMVHAKQKKCKMYRSHHPAHAQGLVQTFALH